jgi:hypothetical protein
MCAQLLKTPIELLQKLLEQLARKETPTRQLLLSFTQLSISKNNFLNNGFTPTILFASFNAFKQRKLLGTICWKDVFWGSNSNKTCDSLIGSFLRLQNKCKNDLIMKL